MGAVRVVAVSDVHVDHGRWGRVNPETGRNTAWESVGTCWREACEYAVETGADAFVATGDMFLNGRPAAEAYEMIAEGFRMLAGAGIASVVLVGNHEYLQVRPGHRHALTRYRDLPGVTVVSDPQVVTLANGLQIAGLPWPRKGEMLSDLDLGSMTPQEADDAIAGELAIAVDRMAEAVDVTRPALLAVHAAIGEATVGSDRRGSEMSIRSVFNEPIVPVEALTLDPFAHVVCGHIHKRQVLADRAHYVGSPDRIDFSEEHEEKGFSVLTVLDDGTATVDLVPTSARSLRTVDVGAGDDPGACAPGQIVRVVLPEGETRLDPVTRTEIVDSGALLVQVKSRPAPRPGRGADVAAVEGVTTIDGLRLWAEREGVDGDGLKVLETLAVGLLDEFEGALS